jgi:hypothetical protein
MNFSNGRKWGGGGGFDELAENVANGLNANAAAVASTKGLQTLAGQIVVWEMDNGTIELVSCAKMLVCG